MFQNKSTIKNQSSVNQRLRTIQREVLEAFLVILYNPLQNEHDEN